MMMTTRRMMMNTRRSSLSCHRQLVVQLGSLLWFVLLLQPQQGSSSFITPAGRPQLVHRSSQQRVQLSLSSSSASSFLTPETTTTTTATTTSLVDPASNNDDDSYENRFLPPINEDYLKLPRHPQNYAVNALLIQTEDTLRKLHTATPAKENQRQEQWQRQQGDVQPQQQQRRQRPTAQPQEVVFCNNYVDLGKIDTVGFDFDYTLVTYTDELLEVIYDMALQRLVHKRQYPQEMLESNLQYDPFFSIRGLAVDKQTGWITHLSYTHKVAVAWEGRERVPTHRIFEEYRGKRALNSSQRRRRLKPLNDLFSMAECCLISDVCQWFKDREIPYAPQNLVTDVLKAVTETHISGDFHRLVANDPGRYLDPTPHLHQVIHNLKQAGKRLIFVSNSPYWYVDAGMKYVFGDDWRHAWDAIITSAGKPAFYTDDGRPFREICENDSERLLYKQVDAFEKGKVYTEGCLKELFRLMDWRRPSHNGEAGGQDETVSFGITSGSHEAATARVLYIGDSLFADLVDAKREFGWTTAAVTPEVGQEMTLSQQPAYMKCKQSIHLLLHALRTSQEEMVNQNHHNGGNDKDIAAAAAVAKTEAVANGGAANPLLLPVQTQRTPQDIAVMDALERLVSLWRDRETALLGNPFGSVFRARYQPSLFAHSLRRYCDLYMTSVSSLRHYSPEHRFYPEQNQRLLAHEIRSGGDGSLSGFPPEFDVLADLEN